VVPLARAVLPAARERSLQLHRVRPGALRVRQRQQQVAAARRGEGLGPRSRAPRAHRASVASSARSVRGWKRPLPEACRKPRARWRRCSRLVQYLLRSDGGFRVSWPRASEREQHAPVARVVAVPQAVLRLRLAQGGQQAARRQPLHDQRLRRLRRRVHLHRSLARLRAHGGTSGELCSDSNNRTKTLHREGKPRTATVDAYPRCNLCFPHEGKFCGRAG